MEVKHEAPIYGKHAIYIIEGNRIAYYTYRLSTLSIEILRVIIH